VKIPLSKGRASATKNAMLRLVARFLIARQHGLCRAGVEAITISDTRVRKGRLPPRSELADLKRHVNREKDIAMTFLKNTPVKYASLLFGSAALVALVSATQVAPAHAQGVPAGLVRLDPPQPSRDTVQLAEQERVKVRSAYARARKNQPH
jgi:hypothetical protein